MNVGIFALALALYIAVASPMVFLLRLSSETAKRIPLSYLLLVPIPFAPAIAYLLAIKLWPSDADGGLFSGLIFGVLMFVVAVALAIAGAAAMNIVFSKRKRT